MSRSSLITRLVRLAVGRAPARHSREPAIRDGCGGWTFSASATAHLQLLAFGRIIVIFFFEIVVLRLLGIIGRWG
jgi:hypothetical protein